MVSKQLRQPPAYTNSLCIGKKCPLPPCFKGPTEGFAGHLARSFRSQMSRSVLTKSFARCVKGCAACCFIFCNVYIFPLSAFLLYLPVKMQLHEGTCRFADERGGCCRDLRMPFSWARALLCIRMNILIEQKSLILFIILFRFHHITLFTVTFKLGLLTSGCADPSYRVHATCSEHGQCLGTSISTTITFPVWLSLRSKKNTRQ